MLDEEKSHSPLSTACCVLLATCGSSFGATYFTTFEFASQTSVNATPTITADSVRITWSTLATSGVVELADLDDLTFDLLNGGVIQLTDQAIISGVIQPLLTISRGTPQLCFSYDFDTDVMTSIDNDCTFARGGGAVGMTFNVFNTSSTTAQILIWDSDVSTTSDADDFGVFSVTQTTIPEPSIPLLSGMGLLALFARRTRNHHS